METPEYSRHRGVRSSGDEEDVVSWIITAAGKKLNEMQAEAATVGDPESASPDDNDTSE